MSFRIPSVSTSSSALALAATTLALGALRSTSLALAAATLALGALVFLGTLGTLGILGVVAL